MSALAPMLADPPSSGSTAADSSPEAQALAECLHLLDAVGGLTLYSENPFRRLGLPTLAGPREVARRAEALAATTKGPKANPEWAFAPAALPTSEQSRAAVGTLGRGAGRLLAELFWFWSSKYPEEGPDPAIDALATGDVEKAYSLWLAAAEKGSAVADHNMAVMFHYAALDREVAAGPWDAEAVAWWQAAAQHWRGALALDELWSRLAARVKRLEDPALPASVVPALRAKLPAALATVHAVAALARAERGEDEAVAVLAGLWPRDGEAAQAAERGCERALAAKADAVIAAIEHCEEKITADDQPCLAHVEEMLQAIGNNRRTIELIAGRHSALVKRLGSRAVEVAVSGVLENERRTGYVEPGLPVLVALATLPAGGEERRQVAGQRGVALDTAVLRALGTIPVSDIAARFEAMLNVFADLLVPAVERFAFDGRLQASYRARLIAELRELAHDASRQLGDFDLPSRAYGLVTDLADEESRPAMMRERKQLWQQFQRAQEGAVQIEHNGHLLEIDARRLTFDRRTLAVSALTGLRFGISNTPIGIGPQVSWCAAREVVVLDSSNLLDSSEGTSERYRQILEAVDACVVPALADRTVSRVRAGQSIVLGPSALRPDGFVFQRRPGQAGGVETVPYAQLTQSVIDGALTIERIGDPAQVVRYPLAEVWNAVFMGDVLARLAALDA